MYSAADENLASAFRREKHEAGTAQRMWDDDSGVAGKRLPFASKAIAAYFIGRAQANPRPGSGLVPFSFIESERELLAKLDIDGKTFRKYLQPLIDAGLVVVDKGRRDGVRRFDCRPLFKRYRDTSQSDRSASPLHDRPVAIAGSPASEVAARLGLGPIEGCEAELAFIEAAYREFEITPRKQRWVIKRYGVYAVAGALAYVAQQKKIARVESAAGLFVWALEKGRCADLPSPAVSPEAAAVASQAVPLEEAHVVGGLWHSVQVYLETRMSRPQFELLLKPNPAAQRRSRRPHPRGAKSVDSATAGVRGSVGAGSRRR